MGISLQDADGGFLTVKPVVTDLGKHDDLPGETVGGTGDGIEAVDELRAALHAAKEQQAVKDQEIARLQEQLEKEERYKKLWSLNCAQLAEFDGTISAKDEEIEQLKSRLHSASDESSLARGSRPLRTPLKVRRRIFYLSIGEEEPLLWKCSVEKIVKILLMIGYLVRAAE